VQRTVLHGDICCLAAKRKGGSESDSDDDEDEDEDEYEFDDGDVRGDGSGDEGNFGGGRSDGDGDKCDVDDEDEEPLENLRHPSVPAPVSELPEISMPPPLSSLLRLAGRTEESPFPVTFPPVQGDPANRRNGRRTLPLSVFDGGWCTKEGPISGDRHLCWARAFSGSDDFDDVVSFAEKMARKLSEIGRAEAKVLSDANTSTASAEDRSAISAHFTHRTLQRKGAEMTTQVRAENDSRYGERFSHCTRAHTGIISSQERDVFVAAGSLSERPATSHGVLLFDGRGILRRAGENERR